MKRICIIVAFIALLSVLIAFGYSLAAGTPEYNYDEKIELHDRQVADTTKIPIEQKQTNVQKQTLTKQSGVFYYNGKVEKYYSSKNLYHYRTSELSLDAYGFYHDTDGLFFVASSDYPLGTIITTSMGQSRVCDCGCACGVIDFYVNW